MGITAGWPAWPGIMGCMPAKREDARNNEIRTRRSMRSFPSWISCDGNNVSRARLSPATVMP